MARQVDVGFGTLEPPGAAEARADPKAVNADHWRQGLQTDHSPPGWKLRASQRSWCPTVPGATWTRPSTGRAEDVSAVQMRSSSVTTSGPVGGSTPRIFAASARTRAR